MHFQSAWEALQRGNKNMHLAGEFAGQLHGKSYKIEENQPPPGSALILRIIAPEIRAFQRSVGFSSGSLKLPKNGLPTRKIKALFRFGHSESSSMKLQSANPQNPCISRALGKHRNAKIESCNL